jgi:hypothetical protein
MLNSVTRTEVLLAYVSSGVNATGETYVPVKFEPAIVAYIVWQDARYDARKLQVAPYFQQQYTYEINMLDEGPTLQEYIDMWLSTCTMLPQR